MRKYVLVTGGAKRLGAAICRTLAQEGYSVVIHYNTSGKEARALAAELNGATIRGSLSTIRSCSALIQRYKKRFPAPFGLINNVGNYVIRNDPHTALALLHTNVLAPLQLIQELRPRSVINIGTSGLHAMHASPAAATYMMTKQALYSLTKSLAKALAPKGTRVNMVSPGVLDNSVAPHPPQAAIPLGRFGTVDEVARVVAFVLGEEYLTGQNIEVAGGYDL